MQLLTNTSSAAVQCNLRKGSLAAMLRCQGVTPNAILKNSKVQDSRHSYRKMSSQMISTLRSANANVPITVEKREATEKLGVFMLNLGGPDSLEDVQPFLYNLFNDPDIIRLPKIISGLQSPLAKFISTRRAPKSARGYANLGGGSPLLRLTQDQANALTEALEAKGHLAKVYIGMRYWHPFTEDAIKKIKADGITKLVILPLYPQYSISTTGSSLRIIRDVFYADEDLKALPTSVVYRFASRPGYVKAIADLIETELKKFKNPDGIRIFFSAHGVPKSYVQKAGDPYQKEMEESVELIMQDLRSRSVLNVHVLAYQSRVGPVEWLKPYTKDAIKLLGQDGVPGLLAVPISFVSEHIETLDEIDIEYRELAAESGIPEWGRVPAMGTYAPFIDDLAAAVAEAVPEAQPVSERDIKLEGTPLLSSGKRFSKFLQSWEGQAVAAVTTLSLLYFWVQLARALEPSIRHLW